MKTWYRLRAARKTAELLIYDEIGAWGITAARLIGDMSALGDITAMDIRINSPGGDVFEAMAIHNALSRHPARITAHIDALCASAATVIALAADEIRMAGNASWMIHDVWTVSAGNAEAMQKTADRLDTLSDTIAAMYARKTGAAADEVRGWMKAETWYTADQALAAGFIDAVDAPLKIAALATHDLSRFKHPPLQAALMTTETIAAEPDIIDPPVDPVEPVEPELDLEPAEPEPNTMPPAALAQIFVDGKEPQLIPLLINARLTAEQAQARLTQAREIRKICALARQPDLADLLIASGATADDAKLETWNALVRRSESAPVDNTPPPANALTRAAFEAMTPYQRSEALRAGRRVVD